MNIQIGDKFKIMKDHPDTRSEDLRKGDILLIERLCSSYGVSFTGGWSGHIRGNDLYLGGLDKALKRVKPTRLELQEQFNEQQETIEGMQSQIHLMAEAIGVNKQGLKEFNKDASQTDSSKEGIKQVIEIDTVGEVSSPKYTKKLTWGNPPVEEISELKTLGQDVFNGLDDKYIFSAVDEVGRGTASDCPMKCLETVGCWANSSRYLVADMIDLGKGFDATNWKKSLIKRENVELIGSDLAGTLLNNQRYIIASVSDVSDFEAVEYGDNKLIFKCSDGLFTDEMGGVHYYAVAIDNNGNVLTAKDVGL